LTAGLDASHGNGRQAVTRVSVASNSHIVMTMKCDRCQQAEAVVHLTYIDEGVIVQRHLCAQCAVAQNVSMQRPPPPADAWQLLAVIDQDRTSG
jgi:hypothetical protein